MGNQLTVSSEVAETIRWWVSSEGLSEESLFEAILRERFAGCPNRFGELGTLEVYDLARILVGDYQKQKPKEINNLVQAIETFLADEEKILNLKDGEVAEANRELYSGSTDWKRFIDHSLTRQEQFGRVDAIIDTLNLVKLTLGYKD